MSKQFSTLRAVTALLGDPVSHSVSPSVLREIFHESGICNYEHRLILVPKERADIELPRMIEALKNEGLLGVNITLPFKEMAAGICASLSDISKLSGVVNVLRYDKEGVIGNNTDGEAAIGALKVLHPLAGSSMLIFGSGGAARAIAFAAAIEASHIMIVNRTEARGQALVEDLRRRTGVKATFYALSDVSMSANLLHYIFESSSHIVNATSCGMRGNPQKCVVPPELLKECLSKLNYRVFLDAVFNPLQTQFLEVATATNHLTVDGLEMLINQAALAVAFWLKETPRHPPKSCRTVALAALRQN